MTEPVLFDPGLQPERTELAWRRTALAIAIGSVVSMRVFPLALPASAGVWGVVPGLVGLVAACALWVAARRRQLRVTAALTGAAATAPPGGGLLFTLTSLGCCFGAVALSSVLIGMLS